MGNYKYVFNVFIKLSINITTFEVKFLCTPLVIDFILTYVSLQSRSRLFLEDCFLNPFLSL